jgi:hypothetical protein
MRAGLGIYSSIPPPSFNQQLENLTRLAGLLQQNQYHSQQQQQQQQQPQHYQQQQYSSRGTGKYSIYYSDVFSLWIHKGGFG